MSSDWLQHAFLMVTVVMILTLILDVCVSKLKTIRKFLIKISFKKHLFDSTENAKILCCSLHDD